MRPPFLPRDTDYSGLFALLAFFCAVAIGLLFLAHAAFAQEPNSSTKANPCISVNEAHTRMEAVANERGVAFAHRVLHGADAARFMVEYNKLPPASDVRSDKVGIFAAAGMNGVILTFEVDGCVSGSMPISAAQYVHLIKASNNERRPT